MVEFTLSVKWTAWMGGKESNYFLVIETDSIGLDDLYL